MSRRLPDAERMRLSRAQRRELGLVRVEVSVPAEDADLIRRLAERRRIRKQIDKPFTPEDGTP